VAGSGERDVPHKHLFPTVDLNRGEAQEVELSNGTKAKVRLLKVEDLASLHRTVSKRHHAARGSRGECALPLRCRRNLLQSSLPSTKVRCRSAWH
jgi:hypothetical protein